MMNIFKAIAVAAVCFVGAPASAQQVVIDDNFEVYGFSWDGSGRGLIRWRPVLIDGKIAICGAYSVQGGRKYVDLTRRAVRNLRASSDGGFFMPNMSFFRQVSSAHIADGATGQMANCRVSATEGTPADLFGFALNQTIRKY